VTGCNKLDKFKTDNLFIGIYISIVIVIMNALLEIFILYFTKKIGYYSVTEESEASKNFIFAQAYFNTSIAILLIGANIPMFGKLFDG